MAFTKSKKQTVISTAYALAGCILFAAGVNLFITPLALYNGGFMGIAQLIRTFLSSVFHLSFGQTDIAGIIYFLLNIPLIFLAWKMGRGFFFRTMITIVVQTAALTLIPVPKEPIIEDYLTACIIGGLISGVGSGFVLRGGSSGGGQDILGLYFTKKFRNFSVGKMSLIINFFVYGVCLCLFDLMIVIYSLIYGVIYSVACDRVHIQNINMSVMIFTKKLGISKAIMDGMGRGVTNWDGAGAYTNETSYILFVMISKYEVNELKQIVKSIDPNAFMIFTEGCSVDGNFEKRL
ncbi:YitT family protein [Sellimonas caecigallum]|uniref:YitT family protein n=1 Tax=Sellimonas caecigallum TaxID=2592333 RepID=A0ABS7LA57_9FIRM|nr:YitT family protein [Sellimonas caecigallum]MBY0759847.1 YitT family protein [Sellimonas caecigallum]